MNIHTDDNVEQNAAFGVFCNGLSNAGSEEQTKQKPPDGCMCDWNYDI
jgi:hypothetical protein